MFYNYLSGEKGKIFNKNEIPDFICYILGNKFKFISNKDKNNIITSYTNTKGDKNKIIDDMNFNVEKYLTLIMEENHLIDQDIFENTLIKIQNIKLLVDFIYLIQDKICIIIFWNFIII